MKSKKDPEIADDQQSPEKTDNPPKTYNFWVNLNNIRSIQRRTDGSGQYTVLYVNDDRQYTFNVNPLEMEDLKNGWVRL